MKIKEQYIKTSSPNRPGKKLDQVRGIVIHWTGNVGLGSTASAHQKYFGRRKPDRIASAHFVVDDKEVIQCIPLDEVAYHVGDNYSKAKHRERRKSMLGKDWEKNPNNYTIGVEICVNADGFFPFTFERVVELVQHLTDKFPGVMVLRHFDVTGKKCPRFMIAGRGWEYFLDCVDQGTPSQRYRTQRAIASNDSQQIQILKANERKNIQDLNTKTERIKTLKNEILKKELELTKAKKAFESKPVDLSSFSKMELFRALFFSKFKRST